MKKAKYLKDKSDKWMKAEDIPDIDLQFSEIWLSSFVNDLEKTVGKNYKKVLSVYDEFNLSFYYEEKDSEEFSNHVFSLIKNDPEFGKKINKKIRKFSDALKNESKKIDESQISKMSNKALAVFYRYLDELHTELYTWGWLPNVVDMFHNNFTNFIKSIINDQVEEKKINQSVVALSVFPEKSILQQENESFLNLVALHQNKSSKAEIEEALNVHLSKYFYLKHLWIGKDGVYTKDYYIGEINKFIKSGESAVNLLKKEQEIYEKTLRERAKLVETLDLSERQKDLIDVYAEFAVTKLYRRDAQIFWAYKMDIVFKELARRFYLPLKYIRFMLPTEVEQALVEEGFIERMEEILAKRSNHCVYYAENDFDSIFLDKDALIVEKKIPKSNYQNLDEVEGQTAFVGKVKGVVKIVNSVSEISKMKNGDILVSIATNPDVVPAMKKAGAIVTEQGGITSHAAIVARELETPCVIGTKIATQVFKDGDIVEVDAYMGTVKKLS